MKWCFTVLGLLLLMPCYLWAQNWQQEIARQPRTDFFQIQRAFEQEWAVRSSEKGKGYKQFKRWEWFWEQRVGKSGQFPQHAVTCKEWDKYCQAHPDVTLLNRQLPAFQRLQQTAEIPLSLPKGNWEPMGPDTSPGGYNGIGRINCIGFHPSKSNTFWVGSPAGGLWKTTDGGQSWTSNTDNLPVLGVSSIAVDYTNPDIIYIATGDADNAYGIPGQPSAGYTQSVGILKSTDGGATWNPTGLHWEAEEVNLIGTLLMHPVYPNVLIAATSDGIYKTENSGNTWQKTQSGHFQDMEFKPGEPSVLYASTFSWGGNAQVYKSSDTGSSWSQKTQFSGLLRIALAVTEANDKFVYALCANTADRGFGGFYQSDNSGNTFTLVFAKEKKNLLGWSSAGSDKGGQGWYDLAVAASPAEQNTVYVGGVNTWKSTDGGENWNVNNVWFNTSAFPTVHADKHFLAFHPAQPNTLFEGNDGGLYKTTNGGNNWTDLSNGLQITQFYRLGTSATDAGFTVAGAQDNGTKRLEKDTWVETLGGDGMECIVDYENANIRYYSQQSGRIFRSMGGANVNITQNIPGNPSGAWVTPYVMDPEDPKTLYAGYRKVFKTTDRGNSWTAISDELDGFLLQSLAVAPSDPQTIYAGNSYNLFATHNGGGKWQSLSDKLPNHPYALTYITVHPEKPETLWVTYSGYADGKKVYLSEDGGKNWENISGTLPNLPVNCIVYQKESAGNLYVGTDVGVFYRNQYMDDWEVFSEGLPNVIVTELEIQYSAGKLRAATFGRGLWQTDILPGDPFIPIQENDSLALVALYNSTNGKNWKKKEGWLAKPVREWEGISVEGDRVKEISLNSNNLKGTIPPGIGDLEQLTVLSLNDNQISGNIPLELGSLKNLQLLFLSNNQFTGEIPAEIGGMQQLKELVLRKNQLDGTLPSQITQLSELRLLDISENKLTGAISDNIGSFDKIREIYFQNNLFTGNVPESLGSLSKLSHVNLSHNFLEGNFPELDHSIESLLDISHNNFTGIPPLKGKVGGKLNVTHNALTFEDISPNIDIKDFTYEPQREIGEAKNIAASEGDRFVINLNVDQKEKNNKYTWFKDGDEIEQTGKNEFVIEEVESEDAGVYTCAITNKKVKGLTIKSKPVTLTIDNRSQFITIEDIPDKTFGDEPFELTATASSGLPVSFVLVSGPATLDGKTLTITGAGKVIVRVEQKGNDDFTPANPVEKSFLVLKAPQLITFEALADKTFGDAPFELAATAASGLPVDFNVVSGPATIENNLLTIAGAGEITVRAMQLGNDNHKAAEPVERSFQVEKATQTITFSKIDDKTYLDAPFSLEASSSAGLPVSYNIIDSDARAVFDTLDVSRTTIRLIGAGKVTIRAEQAGNENYKAAEPVLQSFTVNKAAQTIDFQEIDNKSPDDPPFDLEALATSGLAVNFVLLSGPATLDDKTLTLTGPGEVMVRAEQEGNDNFLAANPVSQTFVVLKGFQQIIFNSISDRIFGDEPFDLTATASSDLPIQYTVVSGPATLDGNELTLTGAGMVTVRAEQNGNDEFEPAEPVEQSFEVAKGFQELLSFEEISDKMVSDEPFEPTALASSGLPVTFSIISGPALVEKNLIELTGTGEVTVLATQPGSENYRPSDSLVQSFVVTKGTQTITFSSISDKIFGDDPFVLDATASSGLPVSFTVISGPVALDESTVTVTGTGTATIKAEQSGDENYEAAGPVEQNFSIARAAQTISFEPIEDKTSEDTPFALNATASSGLPVSFSVVSGPATVAEDMLSLTGDGGEVTVKASQAGNEHFEPAPEVQQSFEVEEVTGIEDEITKAGLNIFPNPAQSQLFIEADLSRWHNSHVYIRDAIGKEVAQYPLKTEKLTIDLSGQSAGLYLILIRKGQNLFTLRFVKE